MRILRLLSCAVLPLALTGCAAWRLGDIEPISVRQVGLVIGEAKRQIGVYQYASQRLAPGELFDPRLSAQFAEPNYVCGRGNINYEITSVSLDLTTELSQATTFKLSGTAGPVPVTASDNLSLTNDNTQELKYKLFPLNERWLVDSDVDPGRGAPIAVALLNLRDASIVGAHAKGACFRNFQPGKPDGDNNTYKLGLTITVDNTLGVSVGLAPVQGGVSSETKSVTGNTLTVTFSQVLKPRHWARPGRRRDESNVGQQTPLARHVATPSSSPATTPNGAVGPRPGYIPPGTGSGGIGIQNVPPGDPRLKIPYTY